MNNNSDPILENNLILKIANRYVTTSAVTGVEESGGEARVYYLDNDKVFKVQRPHRVREKTSQEREVLFLNELEKFDNIVTPVVFGYGRESEKIEYTIMSRIPGKAIGHVNPAGEARAEILFKLGEMLYRLHHLPDQDKFLKSNLFSIDKNRQDIVNRVVNPLHRLAEQIEKECTCWTAKLSPTKITQLVSEGIQYNKKRALHSNPALTHTFVNPDNLTLTGLIDLGDAYISHPSNDLKRYINPIDRQHVFSGYNSKKKVDDAFLSVWLINQLHSDFICLSQNSFKTEALEEIDEIVVRYL
jgi:aminoglycoside phosphotransferase